MMQPNNQWSLITNNLIQEQLSASKEECHLKTENAFDDWKQTLKAVSFQSHKETRKTAKLFTQVDSLSKNTRNSIEKTSQILDELLEKKLTILAAIKDLNDIQDSLDINSIVKNHWCHSSSSVNEEEELNDHFSNMETV
ncbi:uncharacterized protein BX663DRAFT_510198 [Cokeromyces recurvatus]|uniref:uncharacterized protein n=1 Tax=Cokeromyces recurvatus TaxID=90255 RepID=UPI0022211E87|nr:uncharacterized protein BX663DRAFT_510198 [Cokeromyces recurvatus]KAI7902703.1 hypothetical protein BX663DRAFT_510198 [Cokeromyces recurvatus]